MEVAQALSPRQLLCSRQQLAKKLFTKEDPLYLHKAFGLLALVSFVYRYGFIFNKVGHLGFVNGDWGDWSTMAVHLGLSCSSLIFHVLARRILSKPVVIWEEYRLHAIVFTLRCVSVYCFASLFPVLFPSLVGTTVERLALPVLVLAHHVAADEVTRRYGPEDKSQTTVRTDGKSGPWTKRVLRFYSFYQFAALGSHLVPTARLADMGFNTLIAIQSSAFLMTLFRKGLIRYYSHGVWYTGCLILSLWHMQQCAAATAGGALWFWGRVGFAFALRLNTRMSKYAIWSIFVLLSMPVVENAVFETVQAVSGFAAVTSTLAAMGTHISNLRAFKLSEMAQMPAMPELPSLADMPSVSLADVHARIPELPSAADMGIDADWSQLLPASVGGYEVSGRVWLAVLAVLLTAVALPSRRWSMRTSSVRKAAAADDATN